MPHSVHPKLHEGQYSEGQVEEWFDQFVGEYDDVKHGRERIEKSADPAIVIAGATLVVTSIDTLVTIYCELKNRPEVHYINLWGSNSEQYPVQIYLDALGRIENPGQYDLYEIDNEVTLVVCDSPDEVRKVQADVDPDGLVEDLDDTASDPDSGGSENEFEKE